MIASATRGNTPPITRRSHPNGAENSSTVRFDSQGEQGEPYPAEYDAFWNQALETLVHTIRCRCAMLMTHDRGANRGRIDFSSGIAAEHVRAYEERFSTLNPWIAATKSDEAFQRAVAGDELVPTARLHRTGFYREFLQPAGILHSAHAGISRDETTEMRLMLGRSEGDRPFDAEDINVIQGCVGLMSYAWQVGHRRRTSDDLGRYTLEALDRLAVGVAIVDVEGHLLSINEEAERIVGSGDGISLGARGLEIRMQGRMRNLTAVLAENATASSRRFDLLMAERRHERQPLTVICWPLLGPASDADTVCHGTLIFMSDPSGPDMQFDTALLCDLFGMTPAEARLASKMASGGSVDDIAQGLGISVHTARTHLKRIYEKTGVDRHAGLVHVLQTSVGFIRTSDGCRQADRCT